MNVSFIYWEGAVRVQGQSNGQEAEGYGFVELTGYADSMQGRF
jgi:predicted secreted hydrolase